MTEGYESWWRVGNAEVAVKDSIVNKTKEMQVDINLIQPYDPGHLPGAIDQKHLDGIAHVKELLANGKTIRPILVNKEGQRLDGFKRYMGQKEFGVKTITVIVDPHGKMGGQHGLSLTINEGEEND